jgi:hypothetical protein
VAGEKLLFADDAVRVGASNGVVFEVWIGGGKPQHFRDLCKLEIDYALTQQDKRMALLSVVRMESFTSLDGAVRKELEARTRATERYSRASVVILPANGFAASIVRGVLTGLQLVTRSKVPTAVFGSVEEGCTWLAPKLPGAPGRRTLPSDLVSACALIASG